MIDPARTVIGYVDTLVTMVFTVTIFTLLNLAIMAVFVTMFTIVYLITPALVTKVTIIYSSFPVFIALTTAVTMVTTVYVEFRMSGISCVECYKLSSFSANIAVAIFRVNEMTLQRSPKRRVAISDPHASCTVRTGRLGLGRAVRLASGKVTKRTH
jgi:hypothetical protein